MKIKIKNILLPLFIFSNMLFGYLIDVEKIKIFGITINNIVLFIDIFISVLIMLKLRYKENPKYNFKFWCLSFLILFILSSFQAKRLYSQPFFYGIIGQKTIMLFLLFYFPIYKLYYNNIVTKEDILKAIKTVVLFEIGIYILQFFISSKIQFLKVIVGYRYGELRYYINSILFVLLYFIELNDVINNRFSLKKILTLFLIIFEIVVVQKFRLTFLGVVIATILAFLATKKSLKTIFLILILGISLIFFSLKTQMGQDLVSTIFNNNNNISTVSTMAIRKNRRKYYLNFVKIHPYLGAGYPNIKAYNNAALITGAKNSYYLADNGIIAFIFIYGLFGGIWIITLYMYLFRQGILLLKKKNIIYFSFNIYLLITGINEIHWYWDIGPVTFMLYLILLNYDMHKLGENNYEK